MPHSLATHGPTPPIGLAYIAAALRSAGHDVSLIDAAGEAIDQCFDLDSPVGTLHRIGLSLDEIVRRIPADTAIIGITNMFLHEWPTIRDLVAHIRSAFPNAFIVIGGENATSYSEWIMDESPAVDACVLGEGEATMLELADRVLAGQSLASMSGVRHRWADVGDAPRSGVSTGLSVRIKKQELPAIPRPAWDLIPLDRYWAHEPFFGVNRGRAMQVLGTRGCPYKCSFCSSPQMWTTKFVVREPADVVDEIASYVDKYGVENINFVDLTAATNRKWTIGLCDAFEARLPNIRWQLPVGTRVESIDREVLQRLFDTGCRNITFAPESGSLRMLEVMNKRADLNHILEAIRDGHEIGLRTMVNIVLGHPDERMADVFKSMRLLAKAAWAGCDDTAVILFCPYPGSADFDRLVASGVHQMDEAAHYVGLSRSSASHRSWNPTLSSRRLRRLQLLMIGGFYTVTVIRRPKRIIEFVRAQLTGAEDTYLDQMVRTKRTAIPSLGAESSELAQGNQQTALNRDPSSVSDRNHDDPGLDGTKLGDRLGSVRRRLGDRIRAHRAEAVGE